MVRTFKDVAECIPRERLETVAKADEVLCENVCDAGGLRVVHPDLAPLHGCAKFREKHATLAFEILVHPGVQRIGVVADIHRRLEHVFGVQVVRCPVRVSVQVNDIEIAFAVGLFGFTDDAQELCHPVFAIHEAGALLLHLVRTEERSVQNDARVNRFHRTGVFDKACGILPCRKRTGFFPFTVKFVADLPLLDVVFFDFIGIVDPSGGFLGRACTCVYANDGVLSLFRELFDISHELFEMPLDACPVGAWLVAIAGGHREEFVIVPGE